MECTYCSIAISKPGWIPNLTCVQGFRYQDGRIICTNCHQSAIKNEEQVQVILKFVQHCFVKMGLAINWNSLPIYLKNQTQMLQLSASKGIIGYAESFTYGKKVDSRITLLYGMPAALAVETLAHEAGHVWCREHHVQFSHDQNEEEGFCNVLACLVLLELGQKYDAHLGIQAMFKNPDPVYGDKFRNQWAELKIRGWRGYVSHVMNM